MQGGISLKFDNKKKIKQTALDLFGQKGYEETSLSDIAAVVGIKKPSIYNHFSSKEEIFTDVIEDLIKSEITSYHKLHEIEHPGSAIEQVRRVFDSFCHRLLTTKEARLWKRVSFYPPDPFKEFISKKFYELEVEYSRLLRSIHDSGKRNGYFMHIDVDQFTASFLCLIDGVFLEHHYYTEEIFKERIESIWKVYELGLTNNKGV